MTWQTKLKNTINTIDELKKHIKLTKQEEKQLKKVVKAHPMRITKYYLSLINKNDKKDPIRKLMVPSKEELNLEGVYDTSGEASNTKVPGLQHKYKQTALILSTNKCTGYCRFCFRKRFVGLLDKEILNNFNKAINYIKKHKEINNILISGGDPFILETSIIKKFLEKISKIKHLSLIRFGTRIPVVFPERILEDKSLLNLLKKYSTKERRIYIVTHFNHPNELTKKSIDAIDKLIKSNVIVSNQTVLMKDINDNSKILSKLLNKLVSIGVIPYYIFQCRPVKRVKSHFQLSLFKGYQIIEETKKHLGGQGKRFRYVMSHKKGKIEIIGISNNEIYFKYHQAKNPKNLGKFFKKKLNKKAGWLDELN